MRQANEHPAPYSRDATGALPAREPLRAAALRALDCHGGLAALNFSLLGASLRDFARTLSRRRTTWDDWPVDLIGFAMRHQVRSLHWSQAVQRTLLAAVRAPAPARTLG